MRQVTFAQIEPKSFDRIQFGRVGWQWHQRDVVRHAQMMGAMPAGLVEHHDGMLIIGKLKADPAEKQAHRFGRDDRHYQCEPPAGGRLHRAEQMNPGITLVAQSGWPFSARPPAMADAAFLPNPSLVFEPQSDALVWICLLCKVYGGSKPPF